MLKHGMITKSGNYKLLSPILTLTGLYQCLKNNQSIFARNRVTSSAFFYSWNLRTCKKWVDNGWFWTVIKINKTT